MVTNQDDSAKTAKVMSILGVADMIIGLIVAGLGLTGVLPGGIVVAAGGALIALTGVGILLWARNKAGENKTPGGPD